MDRETIVRLHAANLKNKVNAFASRPPFKRPKRTDIQNKSKVNNNTCFSPFPGKWCVHMQATGLPLKFPMRLPMDNIEALRCIREQATPYGLSEVEWNVISGRLVAAPESNYVFWNASEPQILSEYLTFFVKNDRLIGPNKYFRTNWTNAFKAYEYALTMCDNYEFEKEDEIAPKAAIRRGTAFMNNGTYLDNPDVCAGLVALRAKLKDSSVLQ